MKTSILFLLMIGGTQLMAEGLLQIEQRRLFEPTPAELQAERAGRIYIYDGVRDVDVARALDEEFDRVESMMFIRTRVTDDAGEVKKDAKTGEVYVQDDGC